MSKGDRSISIGGNVSGSVVVAGDRNRVQLGAAMPEEQAAVVKELEALRALLATLPGKDTARVTNAVDEALEEAKSAEPRKDVVAESLERALKLTKQVAGAALEIDKLRPGLKLIVHWLGSGFSDLLHLVGL